MTYPVVSVVRPASLAGNDNGRLSVGEDLEFLGTLGRPTARAHPQTVRSFRALRAIVRDGFEEELTVTSSADGYRSYEVQLSTFLARYTTDPIGTSRKFWDGKWWYLKPGNAMAATPGTSNHGWGLALDICYWRNASAVGITANTKCFNWLLLNAHLYGFSWEAQSEPWHIRLVTGDATPAAVVAYETPPAPPPPPAPIVIDPKHRTNPRREHMALLTRWHTGQAYVVATDLTSRTPIDEATLASLAASGLYELVAIDPALLPAIKSTLPDDGMPGRDY